MVARTTTAVTAQMVLTIPVSAMATLLVMLPEVLAAVMVTESVVLMISEL